jgi:hypothetical protein
LIFAILIYIALFLSQSQTYFLFLFHKTSSLDLALMIDQIQKANLYNIQAADIMSKEEMDINTITGFYTLV